MRVHAVLPAVLPALLAAADPLRVLHRLYHPSLPSKPFSERGTLVLSGSGPVLHPSLVPSEALEADLSAFADAARNIEYDHDLVLYQLALEHPGDTHPSQWHVSAVKACHALSSVAETITLRLAADGSPFAIDYFVAPVPHDGACPKKRRPVTASPLSASSSPGASGAHQGPRVFAGVTNTTVLVRAPTVPPLPQLRAPPPLTTEGKPLEPVQEKSFLQKYWIYLAVAVVALILSPGGDDEGQGQGGQRQGGRR